jgi:CheY-like chemotaxis protein
VRVDVALIRQHLPLRVLRSNGIHRIEASVNRQMSAAASTARVGRAREKSPAGARPILIVDDDPRSRLVIGECLVELRLSNPTVELVDGREAMVELQRCVDDAQAQLPVLVLLDLHMPGSSGSDVSAWMRNIPALEDIPVIVLTGDDDARSVTSLYRLGVQSYLVKPVAFEALASVIRGMDVPWMLT